MVLLRPLLLTVLLLGLGRGAAAADSLDLAAPLDGMTSARLRALVTAPGACLAVLDRAAIAYRAIPDQALAAGCGYADAVLFEGGGVRLLPKVTVTCALAVGLVLFERTVLQPQAERYFGSKVVAIEHYGAFSCRNVRHTGNGRRSEHARANAIDLAGFVLADGRRIATGGDWPRRSAAGRFLRAVRDGACQVFPVVLSPVWSAAHGDHFHFDVGPLEECR